ncbi:MAG: type II CAAX endopeptidase family protein [Bacteroidales bacterium]|nr:type II CAAX endopeptidase family protein [Bacteroidales bacterium]
MKFLRFPAVRLVVALVFYIAFIGVASGLADLIRGFLHAPENDLLASTIRMVLVCVFTWMGYAVYCRTIEGRKVSELDARKGVKQIAFGLSLGFGFISIVMLAMWITGGYMVSGFHEISVLWPFVILSVQAGITEEILFRGIFFRIPEKGLGTWWSIVLSALIFGFLHIWNPNATLFSSISIALTAGVILGMLYVITRQLWVPIGMHIGWNFTLGGIYGASVSGGEPNGLLNSSFSGPEWLTGGAFGPEASVITVVVFVVFGFFLIRKSVREKSWISPMWRKDR